MNIESTLCKLVKASTVARMRQRVVGIGVYETCGRCGGCGQYSYCQAYGSTCFQCSGAGRLFPKLTEKLVARVETAIAEGKLDAYFAACRVRKAIKPYCAELFRLTSTDALSVRYVYNDNRPDTRDAFTAEALRLGAPVKALLNAALKLCQDVQMAKGPVDDAKVKAAVEAAQVAFRALYEARAKLAEHPEFCAARVFNTWGQWNAFFPEFFAVTDTSHGKKETRILGAKNFEDCLLAVAQWWNIRTFTIDRVAGR